MASIKISDMTMKQTAEGFRLSFKEKIELAKLLDKLGVAVIELQVFLVVVPDVICKVLQDLLQF